MLVFLDSLQRPPLHYMCDIIIYLKVGIGNAIFSLEKKSSLLERDQENKVDFQSV